MKWRLMAWSRPLSNDLGDEWRCRRSCRRRHRRVAAVSFSPDCIFMFGHWKATPPFGAEVESLFWSIIYNAVIRCKTPQRQRKKSRPPQRRDPPLPSGKARLGPFSALNLSPIHDIFPQCFTRAWYGKFRRMRIRRWNRGSSTQKWRKRAPRRGGENWPPRKTAILVNTNTLLLLLLLQFPSISCLKRNQLGGMHVEGETVGAMWHLGNVAITCAWK